ncbi:MAG: hypothetical protein JRF63_03250, partial [Deltaproteobacteria bacterium]|nr:hypothetical protein [Deltaproteobacteria bacterium]
TDTDTDTDLCVDVVCDDPPDDECSGDDLNVYEDEGTCVDGDCEYDFTPLSCSFGCVSQVGDDVCSGDLCEGVTCDEPPDDVCDDANTLHDYPNLGECNDGDCSYDFDVTNCEFGCTLQSGDDLCAPDPCLDVTCTTPPDDECVSSTLRQYTSPGTCVDGDCIYGYSDVLCPYGCVEQSGDDVCGDTCTVSDVVADGGFELGTPNPSWTEYSSTFGTPLCNSTCSTNPAFVPHSGSWYTWFGGAETTETAYLYQSVYLGDGAASVSFYLWISASAGPASDYLQLSVDSTPVFTVYQTDAASYTAYTYVEVDISAWGNSANHTIRFDSVQSGSTAIVTNFFVDDVVVNACP